jgi:hypothetical protein
MGAAVRQTTAESLRGCARFLRQYHPSGAADADYITFGMATEYLRAFVDNEWTNQMVFGQHPAVSMSNRPGRVFMRAESEEGEERYRNQQRTLRIAELLFNLQEVEGIDARLEHLRSGNVESTYSELEGGAFLRRRSVMFRYVTPSGTKGADYDAEIRLDDGTKVNCEMKTKAEGTDLGEGAVRNPLQTARKQLPPGEPGLVFLRVPEPWVRQPKAAQVVPGMIDAFLRVTSRVVAVVLRWEEQHLQRPDGACILYRFRLERGTPPKAVAPPVERLLTVLTGLSTAEWVSFRAIAEEALLK